MYITIQLFGITQIALFLKENKVSIDQNNRLDHGKVVFELYLEIVDFNVM